MDLEIIAGEVTIKATPYNRTVTVKMEEIKTFDLNTKEVAECIDIETFFDAHGEDEIMSYIEKYTDWLKSKED